ncbi:MAG: TIGR00730 family Rossman fold protein [Rhizomicrobium sp.]
MAHRNTGGQDLSGPSPAEPAQTARVPSQNRETRRICVFCGSSPGNNPAYAQAARGLGRAIGEKGYTLVFGGGAVGLMGEVARAARSAGAPIIGILPAFLRGLEPPLKSAEELIVTPDLQQRKARMLALADAFVILPGGLGTFDEYFEVITTTQLRVHAKPIIVVDVENYFAPLRALLDRVVAQGFARAEIASYHAFVATPAEAMEKIAVLLTSRTA